MSSVTVSKLKAKLWLAMQVDFQALLAEVDAACKQFRKPTLLLFGPNDPFIDLKTVFSFLDDKRTNFSMAPTSTRVRARPPVTRPQNVTDHLCSTR